MQDHFSKACDLYNQILDKPPNTELPLGFKYKLFNNMGITYQKLKELKQAEEFLQLAEEVQSGQNTTPTRFQNVKIPIKGVFDSVYNSRNKYFQKTNGKFSTIIAFKADRAKIGELQQLHYEYLSPDNSFRIEEVSETGDSFRTDLECSQSLSFCQNIKNFQALQKNSLRVHKQLAIPPSEDSSTSFLSQTDSFNISNRMSLKNDISLLIQSNLWENAHQTTLNAYVLFK